MRTARSVLPRPKSTAIAPSTAEKPGRRNFLKGLAGGLAIAVPALGVLASASPAFADDPCAKVYQVILDTWCSNGADFCPVGPGYTCLQQYELRSSTTGQNCGTAIRTLGECGYKEM